VKKFKAIGAEVAIEPGAGIKSGLPDSEFTAVGATVSADALKDADIIIKVKRPEASELSQYKRGALVIAIMDPYGNEAALKTIADAGVSAFAMELMPRITRAQVMDVLSSQANLAGYRAVIEAAESFGRAFPMMMTAAGTVPAAKVFVMGVGVAGLQAIATARRLGAVVTATDVRPATKEQVESRGGLARWSPRPTCDPRRKSRWRAWAQSSSPSRTRNSRTPRPPAATPRKCRKSIRPSRPRSPPNTSRSRTSSSPPR
jgi:NAD(P) transhydrogenase subunit alpha